MFGVMRPYTLHYYRVDDTIEIREQRQPNDGHDPFPVLIGRRKIPKSRQSLPSRSSSSISGILNYIRHLLAVFSQF